MSDAPRVTISRRGDRTHASIGLRDGYSSSAIVLTNGKRHTRIVIDNNAHGEAAAGGTAAVDAYANGEHTNQAE